MPNWCENDLYVYGPDRDVLRDAVRGNEDDRVFDFNAGVTMPASVRDTEASTDAELGVAVLTNDDHNRLLLSRTGGSYLGFADNVADLKELIRRDHPHIIEKGRAVLKARAETRYDNWYDWACDNWGTKWNASDGVLVEQPTRLKYTFQTAWGPPRPVVLALSKKFPRNRLSLRYYERGQCFKGHYVVKNGVVRIDTTDSYHGRRGG